VVPSTRRASIGDRAFAVAGPRAWNSLPPALRSTSTSFTTFKKNLNHFCLDCHSVCDNVYCSLTMFSALAAVCTVDCAVEIVLITLHYITMCGTVFQTMLSLHLACHVFVADCPRLIWVNFVQFNVFFVCFKLTFIYSLHIIFHYIFANNGVSGLSVQTYDNKCEKVNVSIMLCYVNFKDRSV